MLKNIFWPNPYKIEIITSLIEMLELLNFSRMTTYKNILLLATRTELMKYKLYFKMPLFYETIE